MATNKERTLKACEQLIKEYESWDHDFTHDTCQLCGIYHQVHVSLDWVGMFPQHWCRGCFQANRHGTMGCVDFKTFISACANKGKGGFREAFQARADFFKKVIPILEQWPDSRFTPCGWKYSGDEIPREW